MYISRIQIENFRNFCSFNEPVAGNIVIVGENSIGKTNLIYALRLLLDINLPDSARQLNRSDFNDGLFPLGREDKIIISVEIQDFDNDYKLLAVLTDYRLGYDPNTARLTYEFRPKPGNKGEPASEEDYEFVCYGGESETKRFGYDLQRRIRIDLLPALRDVEGNWANWRRPPFRPLLEAAFSGINQSDLESVKKSIESTSRELVAFEPVQNLQSDLAKLFLHMSEPSQDINLSLGIGSTDLARIYRNILLLIDDDRRLISDASLGSANIVFLMLKTLDIKRQIGENKRDHIFLPLKSQKPICIHTCSAQCIGICLIIWDMKKVQRLYQ